MQTSIDICDNVNLDPEMCLRTGRGCLVADQGGSHIVAQFKIEDRGSGPAVPPSDPRMYFFTEGLERKWDFKFY